MWVCASIPPGITYFPAASITVSTLFSTSKPSRLEPGASTAAMVSPSISTSADAVPVEFTTVPFLIRVFIDFSLGRSSLSSSSRGSRQARPAGSCLRLRDARVRVRTTVAEELPVIPHLAHHVHVEVADHDLLVGARAAFADPVAARVDDLAGAVEVDSLFAVLVVLQPDPVRLQHEQAVGDGCRRTLDLPQAVGEPRLGRVRVEDHLGSVQR